MLYIHPPGPADFEIAAKVLSAWHRAAVLTKSRLR